MQKSFPKKGKILCQVVQKISLWSQSKVEGCGWTALFEKEKKKW